MLIRDDSIQYGILDRTFQTAYFTAGLQVEYPHNFFSIYRRLEIAYPVFFFQVFQLLAYQFEVIQEFLFSCFIFAETAVPRNFHASCLAGVVPIQ